MSYLDKFDLVYEHQKKKLEKKVIKYEKSGIPSNPINFYCFLSGTLETIAIGDYILKNDINAYKNHLYNSCQAYIKAVEFYDNNNEVKNSASLMSMISYRELLKAIASDSDKTIKKIANLMGGRGEVDSTDIDDFTYHWGYALKYTLLADYSNAIKHLDKIDDEERSVYSNYLRSIIRKSKTDVLSNIKIIIEHQKNNDYSQGTPSELLSITAIGLIKLARLKGIDILIHDKIAPLELLEKKYIKYKLEKILLID